MKACMKQQMRILSALIGIMFLIGMTGCTTNKNSNTNIPSIQATKVPVQNESDNNTDSENGTQDNVTEKEPDINEESDTNEEPGMDTENGGKDELTTDTEADSDELLALVEKRIRNDWPDYQSYSCEQILMPDLKSVVSLFATPSSDPDDLLNYCIDLWISNETTDTIFMERLYILGSTYGVSSIGKTSYFRFDYAYATDLQTVLLLIEDGAVVSANVLPGQMLGNEEDNIIVTVSTYNSIYIKEDDYSIGHTWNPYYFYQKDGEIKEYQGKVITHEMFMDYVNAAQILAAINQMYENDDTVISYEFILRNNGLLHINIMCESAVTINYYYETYQVDEDNSLKFMLRGEGRYETSIETKKN